MEDAEKSEMKSSSCLPSSLWDLVTMFSISQRGLRKKYLQAAKRNCRWHGEGLSCLPRSLKPWKKTRGPDYISDKTLTFTHSTCAWKMHTQSIFKGKLTFKNDLLFLDLKKSLRGKIDKCMCWLQFSQMNPFSLVIYSVFGILTGYSQSYGFSSTHVWIWELDHKEIWVPKNGCFWTVVLKKS